jgi:hypothetical protein
MCLELLVLLLCQTKLGETYTAAICVHALHQKCVLSKPIQTTLLKLHMLTLKGLTFAYKVAHSLVILSTTDFTEIF